MRRPRIHHPGPLASGARVTVTGSAARHLATVLRLRPGDPLILFDGSGGEYQASVTATGRRDLTLAVGEHRAVEVESPLRIVLAQGVSRGERMDYTVQKAVELGVAAIQPLLTERSVPDLRGERGRRRQAHWERVVIAACEQCGRNRIPEVHPPRALGEWLQGYAGPPGLLLDPAAARGIGELPSPAPGAALLIGPEGGLSPAERDLARERGFTAVTMGPRILRTETAAVAALAVLQARFGDLAPGP